MAHSHTFEGNSSVAEEQNLQLIAAELSAYQSLVFSNLQ
jgi:hypothetical protein